METCTAASVLCKQLIKVTTLVFCIVVVVIHRRIVSTEEYKQPINTSKQPINA